MIDRSDRRIEISDRFLVVGLTVRANFCKAAGRTDYGKGIGCYLIKKINKDLIFQLSEY